MIKVSDYILKFLQKKNISNIFTVSGGGCIHLIDSLGKSNIEYVCCHHEQSATMAAEGYTKMNNSPCCVILTTGPGGINALTGVMGAFTDSTPMFIISGQVSLSQTIGSTGCRQVGEQEFPIIPTVKHMTKYSSMITDKNSIHWELENAYNIMMSGRRGPVWLDIPLDIQGALIEDIDKNTTVVEDFPNLNLNKLINALKLSKKPLIVAGNGIRLSGGVDRFREFLNKYNIPAITTCHSAVDIINDNYKHYCGRFGILGQRSSNKIIQECDLLICIGSRLPLKTTGYDVNKFAPNAKKFLIDIDVFEMNKHKFSIEDKIVTSADTFIENLNNNLNGYEFKIDSWKEWCSSKRNDDVFVQKKHYELTDYASAYVFVERLAQYIPESVPTVTSNGAAHVVVQSTMKLKGNQRLFTNVGCASMGYGLPAAIGACIANNKKSVVCIEGDGSIMMNLQELQTVKHHNLPIKIFIINNDGYSSIKQTQLAFFKGAEYASGPSSGVTLPSFEKIAYGFDIKYYNIKTNNNLDIIKDVLNENCPVICEVFTYPSEPFEPKVIAKGIDSNGKIIPGELSDSYISETF